MGIKRTAKVAVKRIYTIAELMTRTVVTSPSNRKYVVQWLGSLRENYLVDKELPWICFEAITYTESAIGKSPRVFEYGSGGSTLFWLRHNATVVSVEHSETWYEIIRDKTRGNERLDYRLALPTPALNLTEVDPSDPNKYHSASRGYEQMDFEEYVTQIDSFPDAYFDVVSVDGRARTACIKHAIPKVRPGGMLIVDNSSRSWYFKNTKPLLAGFEMKHFDGLIPTNLVTDSTDVFIRKFE